MNSSTTTSAGILPTVVWVLDRAEFVPNLLITLPISLLNLRVVGSTYVLHPNLKLVLCVQSVVVMIYTLCRCVHTSLEIAYRTNESGLCLACSFGGQIIGRMELWGMGVCGWMGYILLAERAYATCAVSQYEHNRSQVFDVIWAFIVLAWSVMQLSANLYFKPGFVSLESLVACYVGVGLNVGAWLLLGYLHQYRLPELTKRLNM